jgi:hypothetical protein
LQLVLLVRRFYSLFYLADHHVWSLSHGPGKCKQAKGPFLQGVE